MGPSAESMGIGSDGAKQGKDAFMRQIEGFAVTDRGKCNKKRKVLPWRENFPFQANTTICLSNSPSLCQACWPHRISPARQSELLISSWLFSWLSS